MKLTNMSAIQSKRSATEYIIEIIKYGNRWTSEALQAEIYTRFGKWYKVSNIERRCRQSDLVASKRVPNKNYNDYSMVQGEIT